MSQSKMNPSRSSPYVPNKLSCPEKFAHHVLLLFYTFRHKKELLSGFPLMYENKLQEDGVQDVVNKNKRKLEPYGDLVDQGFSKINENLINNQDPNSQIENDETSAAEYPNESDSEEGETNKTSALPNFMPQILPDDEIADGKSSLNSKQR